MFSLLYNHIFYLPVYNLLMLFAAFFPNNDVGLAIVLVTALIHFATFPLLHRAKLVQIKMKELEPHVQGIRDKHKDNTQEQGAKIMALYKEHGVNPFSGFLTLFIQLPIIFALYQVVSKISIDKEFFYSFTPVPASLNTLFLGFVDITEASLVLAVLAGLFQFLQANFAMPPIEKPKEGEPASFANDFARSLQVQTKYFLPIFIVFIGWKLPAAVSLYWVTNSGLSVAHEWWVKRDQKS